MHYQCYEHMHGSDAYPVGEESTAETADVVICGINRLNSYDTHSRKLHAPVLISIDPVKMHLKATTHT